MTSSLPTAAEKAAPSRVRYSVLALLCVLAMITYMDRAANGSAKPEIMADLNRELPEGQKLPIEKFYYVLFAFQLAYALFEIPSGWLGDTFGPRSTLLRVVGWWTIFVAMTGFAAMHIPFTGVYVGFWGLVAIQFAFGVGEAGAFPNISKALYNWFPASDRGAAKSAVWMAARFMGGLTPLLWVVLTDKSFGGLTWREAMWLFAGAAAVWCVAFYFLFRNTPAEHPRVNRAELAAIDHGRTHSSGHAGVPWGKIFGSRNLWAVCCMYVVTNFCWYFLMYNLPGEMRKAFPAWGETPSGRVMLALLTGSPLLVGMFGCLLGGYLSDNWIRKTGNRKWGRRAIGMIGYGGAGLCYFAAVGVKVVDPANLWLFAVFLMLMGFMNDLIMAPAWATCQDIGRQYSATVAGTMNMFGNLVGAVSGILITGELMQSYPGTDGMLICMTLYGTVYFVGVGLWALIDASKPLVPDEPVPPIAEGTR